MSDKPLVPTPDALIKAKREPDVVKVPNRMVLAIEGEKGPEGRGFAAAVGALHGVSHAMRFARKKTELPVFRVGVLEGEGRAVVSDDPTLEVPLRKDWRWRVQMGVPSDATEGEVAGIVEAVTAKRGGKLEGNAKARRVRLVEVEGSRYARILHVGPYSTEHESFAKIDAMLAAEGLSREPWHMEVYLSDPNRTEPEKRKTALLTKLQ